LLALKNALDHAKLPDSAAREFFEDVAKDELCICGRHLDEGSRRAVRERAQMYLGSEDVGLLNQIKGDISTRLKQDALTPAALFEEGLGTLQQSIRRAAECRGERDAIKQAAVHDDPELEKKEKEIQALGVKLGAIEEKLRRFEETGTPENDRIEQIWGVGHIHQNHRHARQENESGSANGDRTVSASKMSEATQ
jgi:hypothetical protein